MKKLTVQDFIEKARVIHGNKFDYSEVDYINNCTKVKIKCHQHGILNRCRVVTYLELGVHLVAET